MLKDGVTVYDVQTGKNYTGIAEISTDTITITPDDSLFIRLYFGWLGNHINKKMKQKVFLVSNILRVKIGQFDKYENACFVRMKNNDVYVFIFDKMNTSFVSFINDTIGAKE